MNNKTNESDSLPIEDPSLNYNEDDFIDFGNVVRDLIGALLKFWYILVIISLLCGGLAYSVQKKSYAPAYTSSATVILYVNYGITYSSTSVSEKLMSLLNANVPQIISSDILKKLVANDLGTAFVPGQISAEGIADTSMYKFSVTAGNAQTSYDVLQAVLENFPKAASEIIGTITLEKIDESGVPKNPNEPPSYKIYLVIGSGGGFAVCCIVIVLLSLLKKTIRRESDFRRELNIDCIGGVPNIVFRRRFKKEYRPVLITDSNVDYNFSESLTTICTRIERDQKENNSKVYIIASTLPEEGRSTLAINFAYGLADIGKKVYLIDLDTHNPSIAGILGQEVPKTSLRDVLNGKAEFENAVKQLDESNIFIVSDNDITASSESIPDSPNLKSLIEKSREQADIVLIDVAPVGFYSDVIEIVKYADAVIYVVKQDFVPVSRIKEGIDYLSQCDTRIFGGVLNRAVGGYNNYVDNYGQDEPVKNKKLML